MGIKKGNGDGYVSHIVQGEKIRGAWLTVKDTSLLNTSASHTHLLRLRANITGQRYSIFRGGVSFSIRVTIFNNWI